MKRERIDRLKENVPTLLSNYYGIPPKFIRPELKGVLGFDEIDAKKGICLTGKTGVGKTMALCLLVRDWLIRRADNSTGHIWSDVSKKAWRFIVFPEFIMRVQDAYKNKSAEQTPLEMLEEIAKTPFLIIDDLGVEKPTEYVRQATYFVINFREMNMLPTFITTNFSMDHLDENLDPRISSRIAGMCEILRLEGQDRRITKDPL